jgi:hypothetical protein
MPPAERGLSERVREKLETLPAQPGVYVFRGARDVVLYVGKARSLRSRVRSYFQPGTSDVRAFVARLEDELVDIETFVADTEKEAALLENQLIKEHQPRYNVKLRDGSIRRGIGRGWRSCAGHDRTARTTSGPTTRPPPLGRLFGSSIDIFSFARAPTPS